MFFENEFSCLTTPWFLCKGWIVIGQLFMSLDVVFRCICRYTIFMTHYDLRVGQLFMNPITPTYTTFYYCFYSNSTGRKKFIRGVRAVEKASIIRRRHGSHVVSTPIPCNTERLCYCIFKLLQFSTYHKFLFNALGLGILANRGLLLKTIHYLSDITHTI